MHGSNFFDTPKDIEDIYQYLFHINLNYEERGYKKGSESTEMSVSLDSVPNSSGVEVIITIDGRGQIVIPKEVRKKANLNDGDKMALISLGDGKGICCLMLVPTDTFSKDMSHFMQKILSGVE